jgi:hypothetical protein
MHSPVKYDPRGDANWMKAVAISMGIPVLFKGAIPTPTFFMPSASTLAVAGCSGVQLEGLSVKMYRRKNADRQLT